LNDTGFKINSSGGNSSIMRKKILHFVFGLSGVNYDSSFKLSVDQTFFIYLRGVILERLFISFAWEQAFKMRSFPHALIREIPFEFSIDDYPGHFGWNPSHLSYWGPAPNPGLSLHLFVD
jgi:hypothetical protein